MDNLWFSINKLDATRQDASCWLSGLTQRSRESRVASWRASTNCQTRAATASEHTRRVDMSPMAETAVKQMRRRFRNVMTVGRRWRSVRSFVTRNEVTAECLQTSTHDLKIGATEQTSTQMIAATEHSQLMLWCLEIDRETSIDVVQIQLQENQPMNEVWMIAYVHQKWITFFMLCYWWTYM